MLREEFYIMSKLKQYESPLLEYLSVNSIGKHSLLEVSDQIRDENEISSILEPYDLNEIISEFGSPVFIISENTLRSQFKQFRDTFTTSDIDTKIAYSYKTNYLPSVCSILHEEGALAEVVSGMEYSLAKSLGVSPENIIFNGPHKTNSELETALQEGALVNIDNFEELNRIIQIVSKFKNPIGIGLRVNFIYDTNSWTKFGFNIENGDCQKALEMISANSKLKLDTLHFHGGTYVMDPNIYKYGTSKLLTIIREAKKLGLHPKSIDLGGGFPSGNQLKPEFNGQQKIPNQKISYTPYAERILNQIKKEKKLFEGKPSLILEPGRAIIDSPCFLACTIISKKEILNQGTAVVVDAGVNILPTAYWYNHNVQTPKEREEVVENLHPVRIYGPLCMQIDVLRDRVLLPELEVGSPLLFSNVGAYCLTQSMQFIQTRPPVVLLGPNGPELIRRKEKWKDVFALDLVPKRLRQPGHEF